ncbi:hypothetical protein MVES1_002830 [Malassezia vespertilionis]|uniref:Uncharacterized protein n=1 Tax=Malassezia vespertilionis TaxID=2020962 RepID=A0A2N1JAM7_9BASI|nr:uncharacterized protein MVES1_002830 [Malassezia vespertilionis]PKI83605.1 hypothetical protein MVES_002675 [Malassezia vespertilionis]WFD07464.1 hypothetical protein MVES1_002830 [Malassezia vespertilionis]
MTPRKKRANELDAAQCTRVVRGTVTPSRASRFFLPQTPPARKHPSTPPLSIHCSTPYMATPTSPHTPSDAEYPVSPSLGRKKQRVFALHDTLPPIPRRSVSTALWAMRTRTPMHGMPMRSMALPYSTRTDTYLGSFSPHRCGYRIASLHPHETATPLAAAHMHGSSAADGIPCVAVGDDEGRVHLLDTSVDPDAIHSAVRHSATLLEASVFALQWRADDCVLAVGGSDYSVSVWDIAHSVCVASYDRHQGSPRALAWDPSAPSMLASGARDGDMYIWDVRMRDPALYIARAHARSGKHRAGVTSVAFLQDRAVASTCSENGVVKLWDLRHAKACASSADVSQRGVARNTRAHGLSDLVYAPSRARLYASCTDGCIYTLDASLLPDPWGRTEPIAYFSEAQGQNTLYARMALHQERFLALGCNSGDVVLWDTCAPLSAADSARRVATNAAVLPRAHETNVEVNSVSWGMSAHGMQLVSACDDGTLQLWRSEKEELCKFSG